MDVPIVNAQQLELINTVCANTLHCTSKSVLALRPAGAGEKEVFVVDVVEHTSNNAKKLLFKLFRSQYNMAVLDLIDKIVTQHQVKSPRVVYRNDSLAVEELVEGIDLCKVLPGFKWSSKNPADWADEKTCYSLFQQVGEQMALLHSIPLSNTTSFGPIIAPPFICKYQTWAEYLFQHQQWPTILDKCVQNTLITTEEKKQLEDTFNMMVDKHFSKLPRISLIHTDIDINNVRISSVMGEFRVTAIFDWSGVMVGDPLLDLGNWLSVFRGDWDSAMIPLLNGYYSGKPTITNTEKLAVVCYALWIKLSFVHSKPPEWNRNVVENLLRLLKMYNSLVETL